MDISTAIKLIPGLENWSASEIRDMKILTKEEVLEMFDAIDEEGLNEIEIASLCLTALKLLE